MKYKIYISILIIIICFLPIKSFGYFANPDKSIHSMSFGAQQKNTDIQNLSTPKNLVQIDNEINNENLGSNVQNANNSVLPNSNANNSAVKYLASKNASHPYSFAWIIFFIIIILAIAIIFLAVGKPLRHSSGQARKQK